MIEQLTLKKCIELAIATEKLGAEFYARMERKFDDNPELKAIFGQLVKDEKAHEAQFTALLTSIPEEESEKIYEKEQFLRATALSEIFSASGIKKTDDIKTSEDALGKALALEKSTLLYYQAIKDVLGVTPQLDEIIEAEKNHVTTIFKVISADAKFRSLNDLWE